MNLLQQKLYQESLKNRSESTLQQVIADTQLKNLVSESQKIKLVTTNWLIKNLIPKKSEKFEFRKFWIPYF